MPTINLSNMHVAGDQGQDLGHVFDAIRNDPSIAASVKGQFDVAWLNREQAHAAVLATTEADCAARQAQTDAAAAAEVQAAQDAAAAAQAAHDELKADPDVAAVLLARDAEAKAAAIQAKREQIAKLQAEVDAATAAQPDDSAAPAAEGA